MGSAPLAPPLVAPLAVGLKFKSWTGQILHSVASGLPPLQHLRR